MKVSAPLEQTLTRYAERHYTLPVSPFEDKLVSCGLMVSHSKVKEKIKKFHKNQKKIESNHILIRLANL